MNLDLPIKSIRIDYENEPPTATVVFDMPANAVILFSSVAVSPHVTVELSLDDLERLQTFRRGLTWLVQNEITAKVKNAVASDEGDEGKQDGD